MSCATPFLVPNLMSINSKLFICLGMFQRHQKKSIVEWLQIRKLGSGTGKNPSLCSKPKILVSIEPWWDHERLLSSTKRGIHFNQVRALQKRNKQCWVNYDNEWKHFRYLSFGHISTNFSGISSGLIYSLDLGIAFLTRLTS